MAGCNNFYQLGMEIAHNELYQGSHQALLKNQVESLQRAIYDKVCVEKVCWSHLEKIRFQVEHLRHFHSVWILMLSFLLLCYLLLSLIFNNNNIIIIVVFLNIIIIIICSLKLQWKGSCPSESASDGQCQSHQSEF